ncbi:MAG: serine--tRNA ligase [Bacilli bacterium]
MLDINLIRENAEKIRKSLFKKGWETDFKELLSWDVKRKELLIQVEANKAEQNRLSKSVPIVKKEGGNIGEIFAKVKDLDEKNKNNEVLLKELENKINDFLAVLPNIPDDDLVAGGKENNQVVSTFKNKPEFGFKIKDHVELAESLGLIDFERGAKIAGRGSWVYTGLGAQLEWALLNFFIAEHLKDKYEFILPPHLLNEKSGYVAGQFPKFKEDVFWLEDVEPVKFLLPTAETALVNLHRDEILSENELPKKYFAYTPCYRKEAGSYRTEERGTIRGYQFNKVEMVQYTTQDQSDLAFIEMVEKAERLVRLLGLHYQVSKLAAGDISHAMAKTYDIEVWIPSIGIYKEVSSVSNARDYQARRGMVRYRDKETEKVKFAHTLNGSGLATSRIFPALLEQFQQSDGSVLLPECLWPFMGGVKILKPIK